MKKKKYVVTFTEGEAHAVGYALRISARRLRALSPLDRLFRVPVDTTNGELAARLDSAYKALDASVEL